MAMVIWTNVAHRVGGRSGMSVGVAIKTSHALRCLQATPVIRGIELLLRERGDQQTQTLDLLGIENIFEQFIEVGQRHQFALRNITQIQPSRQIDGSRKFGQKMVRHVEVEIEAG